MNKKELNNNNSQSSKGNYIQNRVAIVLKSMAHLFQPFKDVIVNVLPSSKIIVKILDFIGKTFSKFVLLIAGFIPKLITFVKSKIFKIIIGLIILIVVINTIISRVMNTNTYKHVLAKAIYEATGYQTIIEGRISVNFLLMSLTVYNAAFYSPTNKNSEISLNLLSVNHLKIKFSFLSLFIGSLKPSKVEVNRAEVRYKAVASPAGEDEFISLTSKVNDATNLNLIIPPEAIKPNSINNITNNGTAGLMYQNDAPKDNIKKYINLKDVFAPKTDSQEPTFFNVDEKGSLFKIFNNVIKKLTFKLTDLNELNFSNVIFKLIDSNNKTILLVDNLSGELNKSLTGSTNLTGEARFLNKNVFFKFVSSNYTQHGNKFSLIVSNEHNNFSNKDLLIEGYFNKNHNINGNIIASGDLLKSIINQANISTTSIKSKDSFLKSDFQYSQSILSLNNLDLILNNVKHNAALTYNFSGSGIVKLDLNLNIKNLDDLFSAFSNYRKGKSGSTMYLVSEALLEWMTHKNTIINPKYFSVNLNIHNTSLNNTPLSNVFVNAFLDNNDNLYINNLRLNNTDFNFNLLGKIQLINKSGTLIVNSEGEINSLCKYISQSDNLGNLLHSIAGRGDYNLAAKVFLADDRMVLNDINGNFGNKVIKATNATLVERSNVLDLLISSKFDVIDFKDLYNTYNFNKNVGRLYYNTNSQITGIHDNLKIHLNIYSDKFLFKDLTFNNFQMEGTIISSGILVHNFLFHDETNTGSVSGSFNFNDKVAPAVIGNIDFNNILLQLDSLNNVLFNNYNISGKVVVNGGVSISGDNYYNGINRVNGKLSLVKYERLKINKENKTQGLYLTLMKLHYKDQDYYQIGDLYGNITIYNNKINIFPNIIRYINNNETYRGALNGEIDILNDIIDLKGILENEDNTKKQINVGISGKLNNLQIN